MNKLRQCGEDLDKYFLFVFSSMLRKLRFYHILFLIPQNHEPLDNFPPKVAADQFMNCNSSLAQ